MHFKAFIAFIFLTVSGYANAHEMNPARLILQEEENANYLVTWMFPSSAIGLPAEVSFPDCEMEKDTLPKQEQKYLISELKLACSNSIKGKEINLKGLSRATDALISIKFLDGTKYEGLATVKDSSLIVPQEVNLYPTNYFWLGIEHLLSGIDHMLFVFGLLFLVVGFRTLIKTITAFTIAHSITLALSVLGIFSLPQASTEAFIALTLIYLAFEVGDNQSYKSTPWLLAFGFGLLHGFGFAGALTDVGFSSENMLFSLLFFNLGIEAGQLLVLPFFGLFVWLLNNITIKEAGYKFSSYLIGGLGSFWLIERVLKIV
jgi:hydrogenase/urease accessory protein HupE